VFLVPSKLQVTFYFPFFPFYFSHLARISLNRHPASSTFYPTYVILDAFDHRHSTSILSTAKYLELLDHAVVPLTSSHSFKLAFFINLSQYFFCICITNRPQHSPYCYHYTVFFIYICKLILLYPPRDFLCNLLVRWCMY
jgi:hypothetical protein